MDAPRRPRDRVRVSLLGLVLAGSSCTGEIDRRENEPPARPGATMDGAAIPPGDGRADAGARIPEACGRGPRVGPAPLRRLTRVEYNNTLRDLLGDTSAPANALPPEARAHGFDTDALGNDVTTPVLRQLMTIAEDVALRASRNLPKVVVCKPAEAEEDCAARFVRSFGERAFRRPLEAGEAERLMAVYAKGRSGGTLATGVQHVVEHVLQSPDFLYLVETGGTPTGDPKILRLSPFQIASRLSYFLWRTMPDEALMQAARTGALATDAGVAAEVDRMLNDPKGKTLIDDFHAQWLALDEALALQKDATATPWFSPALGKHLVNASRVFIHHVVWNGKGDLATLLTAPHAFVNKETAPIYGIDRPLTSTLEKVELDAGQRAGLLTQGTFLASAARANDSAPVKRGVFLLERILCAEIAPPPASLDINLPPDDKAKTTRALFAAHSRNPQCAPCHDLIDPLGFAFERYDGVGRWRDAEKGVPVDSSAEVNVGDVRGRVTGAVELVAKLARSKDVERCAVDHWFHYAFGRDVSAEDRCALEAMRERFSASGGNVLTLVRHITGSEAFLFRRAP